MKIKIQIKNRWLGSVLFEYEAENNTIKETLRNAVLSGADLSGADLRNADLRNAVLRNADLSGAVLSGAVLSGADLRNAVLSGAVLSGAVLSGAVLRKADLSYADLSYADLRKADLSYAVLRNAVLSGADLRNAVLRNAVLSGALGVELALAKTRILPEGDLIGYKKCRDNIIVKLKIPNDAKRSQAFGRKCRAEFAEVLEIYGADIAFSQEDSTFEYKVGTIVKPTKEFDSNWMNECSTGIHFFITKIEAENY